MSLARSTAWIGLWVSVLASCRAAPPPAEEGSTVPADATKKEPEPTAEVDASTPVVPESEPAPELPEPVAEVDVTRNSAEALVASVDRITFIEVGKPRGKGRAIVMRFDDAVRDELIESLRDAPLDDGLSATTPPWPGTYVFIHVEGREQPFVASMTGTGGLRVNAADPYSLTIADAEGRPDFANIRDVGYSESMLDAARETLGPPESIEYSPRPRPSVELPSAEPGRPKKNSKKRSKKRSKKGKAPELRPPPGQDDMRDPFGG